MTDIIGTTGNDVLNGTSGNDLIVTNGGVDTVTANDGDDVIAVVSQTGSSGSIDGGAGTDTLRIDRAVSPLIFNGSAGVDQISISNFVGTTLTSLERIAFNSAVGEVFSATFNYGGNNAAPNQFGTGISTTAELIGGAGSDTIVLRYNNAGQPGSVTLPDFTYTNWTTPLRPYQSGDGISISVSGAGPTTILIGAHAGLVRVTGGSGDDMAFGSDDMEVFNGSGTGTDLFLGGGGDDAMFVTNSYLLTNGVPGPQTTNSGAGKTFDGGSGTDWLIFGGGVIFQGTVSNVEGIVLAPAYTNNNMSGAPILAGSQYASSVTMNNSTLAGFSSNLILVGIGTISVNLLVGGDTFNGSGFVFEAGSVIEFVIRGTEAADTITGTATRDVIEGTGGADVIDGGLGDDDIYLLDGTASLNGGGGTDQLVVFDSATASGTIAGFEILSLIFEPTVTFTGAQFASGFAVNTTLQGTGTIVVNLAAGDNFFGSQMVSLNPAIGMTINGSTGSDVIKAVLGVTNTLNGGGDADQIRGGNQGDQIFGGDGNDKIIGFNGADQLTGGTGADQFRYLFAGDSGVGARDIILDFTAGTDKLDFRALDANLSLAGRQTLSFVGTGAFTSGGTGEARYAVSGGDLLVQIDLDGNGTTDMEMLLQGAGMQTLTGTDFLF